MITKDAVIEVITTIRRRAANASLAERFYATGLNEAADELEKLLILDEAAPDSIVVPVAELDVIAQSTGFVIQSCEGGGLANKVGTVVLSVARLRHEYNSLKQRQGAAADERAAILAEIREAIAEELGGRAQQRPSQLWPYSYDDLVELYPRAAGRINAIEWNGAAQASRLHMLLKLVDSPSGEAVGGTRKGTKK